MDCMRIGPEKVDAMVDYAFGHNLSLNGHIRLLNAHGDAPQDAVNVTPRREKVGGSNVYAEEYEDELNGQAKGGVTDNSHDLNDNMEGPDIRPNTEISRSPVKTPIELTSNYPRLPSSLEASTGSGYFYDDDFSTQLGGGNYTAIDMDTFENEDISSFFAVYNNQAPENKMVLVRTRSDGALYNYELELSMSERTSSRGQSSSGYDCASSAELSFRSDQVYSPAITHSSLHSGPLFSSSQDGVVPQTLYSTDSLDRTELDGSIASEDDFNIKACFSNKSNYVLAFDRSPSKYSDEEQEYHDAWLSDATENLDPVHDDDAQTDSEYLCSEMDHSAGEMVYLDDYYSNEHEPLLAEHMLLSAEHENILPDGVVGAVAEQHWNESPDEISEEFHSDDTQVVPEDCGYRSASDQDDSAINVQEIPEDSLVARENLDQSADNTMDDYDSQLLDEIEQELQMSADISESFAYDNLTFEEDGTGSLHASQHNVEETTMTTNDMSTGMEFFQAAQQKQMAASDSAQLISPDYEMMYSYPEGLSEVLAGRMNGGRLLKRWRNIQQNLHDLSSSEPITTTDPTDSIEPRAALQPLGTFTLKGGTMNGVSKPMICWGQKLGDNLDVPRRNEKEFHSSDSTLENISWTSRENSVSELSTPSVAAPKSLTTWQQVKKARTPQTSWKKIKEMKQFLRDEELLASSASKCKSAPNLAQECDSASERDEVSSICYRSKREKHEDVENKRHSFTLFEIFRRSKSEDQEYGKLPSPIYQKLYGSLMATDGYFLNHMEETESILGEQRSTGINRSEPWPLGNGMDRGLQHSQSSSINKINSCAATPGSSSNSCGSSPLSDANLVPPPYGHHSLDTATQGPILDGENLQAHNARTNGLMQHVSLLPIIQANFSCSEGMTRPTDPVTTFADQGKAASLKRGLEAMQNDEQPVNNAFKHRLLDQVLVDSGAKFVDSITSFSGDTVSKPVYTTSSPNVFCRAVQTSLTITQAGKITQECQTSFDQTSCDEQFLSVEKSNSSKQAAPVLQVGHSPTSQSQSTQYSHNSRPAGAKGRSQSAQRLGCADDFYADDAYQPKDKDNKLSRSLMFMNTQLPDLSFLNRGGMSKSTASAMQHRKPLRSKSCDYSQNRREDRLRYFVKPKQKIVVIGDEEGNSASLTDAETLATEMQQESKRPGVATRTPQMVLMNNEQLDNGSSVDSASKATTYRKIEIVRNGRKSGKLSNKISNLEKDQPEKGKPEKQPQNLLGYYGNMSSTSSSAMDISSDSQASHNNGVLNTPRLSRRDGQAHHHSRCSSRSHDHHGHHGNQYERHDSGSHHGNHFDSFHGNHCNSHHSNHYNYQNPSFCHKCYMEQVHAMHQGNHCRMHHCSPSVDNPGHRNHAVTSPDGQVYYSDEDQHSRQSHRGYNTHRANRVRRSSSDTDNSSQNSDVVQMDESNRASASDQSTENQASCNESDASSMESRQLKPIIKQRKRRPVSAPSGMDAYRQTSIDRSSDTTTGSEKSSASERSSEPEVMSDDGAPTVWSGDDHSVIRGDGRRNNRKISNRDSPNRSVENDSSRRNYGLNLRNDLQHQASHPECCPMPYQPMYPCCFPPGHGFHGCGHMMFCCHYSNLCCGGYNSRLRRNKKSVSFSEEIKYHSPHSSPHCSPKKQQKTPLSQDNGRDLPNDRKEKNRTVPKDRGRAGTFYPDAHVSESSVDSAIGSESPPREFQISPTRHKAFDHDEMLQKPEFRAKKDLVLEVGRAVEVLQSHYSQAMDSQERVHLGTSSDCPKVGSLLLSHLCPALYNLLGDGLKPRTHSLVGQIKNNLWKVIEESADQCVAVSKVMIEIVKEVKSQIRLGSPLSKFNAFVFGLLNAKALVHWLTILQSQDKILQKHYNHDAFVLLSLNTKGRILFGEVIHLCKPLASLPFRVECSFEFKFRNTLSGREAGLGAEPFRKNAKLRRQEPLDELEDQEAGNSKWNGRLQLVQTSNSTLTSSDTSSRDITSSEDFGEKSDPVLPELFQKTDVKQYIQQAREWIENGSKISDSAMDYLGQHFHREFGQFSQHPSENNRWSLPPIETVFSLANFFSKSTTMQSESPSVEGFALYLARISAENDHQEIKAVAGGIVSQGSAEKMSPCEEVVADSDESLDDLISFEEDGTLKEKLWDEETSGSEVASLSSEEIKVEQLIKDNEIVSPQLLELDDDAEKTACSRNAEWLIKFKAEEDVAYKSTEYEFDGKLSIAMGGEESTCDIDGSSTDSNVSFDQHLEDMGILRQEPIRREDHGFKRLSCPLLRFTNESGRDEQHPKRWSLGASLINVFDKLLLDGPQKISPGSSGTFATPLSVPGGHILDSPNLMHEVTSSESESFRSALSCGDYGLPPMPAAPLKPVTVSPVVNACKVAEKSASVTVAVRPRELSLRKSNLSLPKSMTSSVKTEESHKAQKGYVQALCFHQAGDSEQLSFEKGDIMMTLKELDDDWYFCCHGNKTGLVKQTCVKGIEESEVLRRLNSTSPGE